MKIFVLVIVAAVIVGGFAGGEATGRTFSILWASVVGVSTFAVLMGLGAFFHYQEKKKKTEITPEIRAVFDRMTGKQPYKNDRTARSKSEREAPQDVLDPLMNTMHDLLDQDLKDIAAGKIQDRRLIPHYGIKRAVIIKAFHKDFAKLSPTMQENNREHFEGQIAAIKQWSPSELDRMLETMKHQRSDLKELEWEVRAETPMYNVVREPLFP